MLLDFSKILHEISGFLNLDKINFQDFIQIFQKYGKIFQTFSKIVVALGEG